jgi:hypothetical protein
MAGRTGIRNPVRGGDILNVFLFFLQIFGQDDR